MAKTHAAAKSAEKVTANPKGKGSLPQEATQTAKTNILLTFFEQLDSSRIILLIALVCCLAYANSLGGDFVFDDTDQIVENKDIHSWDNLGRAFTTHVWAFRERPEALRVPIPPPYYRPLFTILFTVEYKLFGLWPQGWHLVSLLLHILCSVGVYYVLLLLAQRKSVAVIASLLFAVYSIHVESVSWISGVTDPLFGVFFLASFYFYLRHRAEQKRSLFILSLIMFGLSTLSKETALSLVGLVFCAELIETASEKSATVSNKEAAGFAAKLLKAGWATLPYFGVAILYLIPRYLVIGGIAQLTPKGAFQEFNSVINVSYSNDWLYHYGTRNYATVDPVLQSVLSTSQTQVWEQTYKGASSEKQLEFVEEARSYGLTHGLTTGILEPGRNFASFFSFAGGDPSHTVRYKKLLEYLLPYLHRILMANVHTPSVNRVKGLSPRELMVLEWMKQGKTNWEISRIIGVSERTVRFHVESIFAKLDVGSRTQAVACAIERGLFPNS